MRISQALLAAGTPVCTVVGKTWTLHVTEVLRTSLEENLRIIQVSLAYLKANGREVIYDAEHFFDGYKADPDYAIQTLKAADQGGADVLVLCDTNGGSLPWEVARIVQEVRAALPDRVTWYPYPQRWRVCGGEHPGSGGAGCPPCPGHDQWLRRADRQRQSVQPDPGFRA